VTLSLVQAFCKLEDVPVQTPGFFSVALAAAALAAAVL
jgi:hypothetical protein